MSMVEKHKSTLHTTLETPSTASHQNKSTSYNQKSKIPYDLIA